MPYAQRDSAKRAAAYLYFYAHGNKRKRHFNVLKMRLFSAYSIDNNNGGVGHMHVKDLSPQSPG